ncbi:hypothetical protein E2C01_017891 [Portunus trituberculatus]|uniref:Uncharacterized protein n=1 Tax=Portunus trituberculatus TaxID=210409 RepID=A0A5B7DUR0_PORTR|nr:hypothetical protein [Portunus trituberculatus]
MPELVGGVVVDGGVSVVAGGGVTAVAGRPCSGAPSDCLLRAGGTLSAVLSLRALHLLLLLHLLYLLLSLLILQRLLRLLLLHHLALLTALLRDGTTFWLPFHLLRSAWVLTLSGFLIFSLCFLLWTACEGGAGRGKEESRGNQEEGEAG